MSKMKTYWGELHTHTFCCDGRWGSIEEAAAIAREHLDFWAPAEHHNHELFDWERCCRVTAGANDPGRFVALPGFEVGTINGDFNAYFQEEGAPAYRSDDLLAFFEIVRRHGGIVVPHHTGYKVGCRGMQWERYFQQDITPLLEVFSMHGASERDGGPYPLDLGWMGPRESGGCALAGLQKGHRFGFVASCDGHNGYPGAYGMGLTGIKAAELTRPEVFSALRERRTWAVTGDRIDIVDFQVNGRPMGAEVPAGPTEVRFEIEGLDTLDTVDVIKNGQIVRRFGAWEERRPASGRYVARVCCGWGAPGQKTPWQGQIEVRDGTLRRVSPILGPPAPDHYTVAGNRIDFSLLTAGYSADWWSNRYRCGGECGFAMVMDGDPATRLDLDVNGLRLERRLGELLQESQIHFLPDAAGQQSSAKLKLDKVIPECSFRMRKEFRENLAPGDFLYLRIRQDNGQMAWTSPVFATGADSCATTLEKPA
jgi:hypothetical protein